VLWSGFIESGSGSSISCEFGYGHGSDSGSRLFDQKYKRNTGNSGKHFLNFFIIKNCKLLIPRLLKGYPSYREAFSP
jgi:hypothetical protein